MHGSDDGGPLAPAVRVAERFIAGGEVGGAALAASRRGRLLDAWYGGMAAPGLPSEPSVLWPLASISKLYTAATVMALVEQGRLTLSMPVCSVVPGFTGGGREHVRLCHLLAHTSGLIYESPNHEQRLRDLTPLDALIDEAYEHDLLFTPGSRHSYSDFGYGIAGRIAGIASGGGFHDAVRTFVLKPAGLTDTLMPPAEDMYGRVAHVAAAPADGSDGAMYNSAYGLGLGHPAFGTVATLLDLLRFGELFLPQPPRRLLSGAAVRAMTTDQTGSVPGNLLGMAVPVRPWGMGFWVRGVYEPMGMLGDLFPPGAYGHPGASGCALMIEPATETVIAFVSNQHINSGAEPFIRRLAAVLNATAAALSR